jgi:hypothetical protein
MQRELFDAFDENLRHFRAEVVASLARPRVSFATPAAAAGAAGPAPTGVIDIANQARAVLEQRYATSMDAAAASAVLSAGRALRTAAPGAQNIFDASSEADRATLTRNTGPNALAPGVAWWLFENDNPQVRPRNNVEFATAVLDHHDYTAQDDPNDQFRSQVANAYAAQPNKARELIDYRMARWSERGTQGITLRSQFDPGANRNRAELSQRWTIFKSATHESLHLRAHPAFVAAEQRRATMKEACATAEWSRCAAPWRGRCRRRRSTRRSSPIECRRPSMSRIASRQSASATAVPLPAVPVMRASGKLRCAPRSSRATWSTSASILPARRSPGSQRPARRR